jgi:hypothetical protein
MWKIFLQLHILSTAGDALKQESKTSRDSIVDLNIEMWWFSDSFSSRNGDFCNTKKIPKQTLSSTMHTWHFVGHRNEKILPQRKHWLGEIEPLGFLGFNTANDYSSLLLWSIDFLGHVSTEMMLILTPKPNQFVQGWVSAISHSPIICTILTDI